ncbi:hypothetical protein MTBUT4_110124 [Magnetospirillum sp. UT-4]|nr:hypothetical protein MTBUT4_110124 [Magnetospirillum sp. UT-4]
MPQVIGKPAISKTSNVTGREGKALALNAESGYQSLSQPHAAPHRGPPFGTEFRSPFEGYPSWHARRSLSSVPATSAARSPTSSA